MLLLLLSFLLSSLSLLLLLLLLHQITYLFGTLENDSRTIFSKLSRDSEKKPV